MQKKALIKNFYIYYINLLNINSILLSFKKYIILSLKIPSNYICIIFTFESSYGIINRLKRCFHMKFTVKCILFTIYNCFFDFLFLFLSKHVIDWWPFLTLSNLFPIWNEQEIILFLLLLILYFCWCRKMFFF